MDRDGQNMEKIGYLNIQSALHPVPMPDGRYLFSSSEGMGIKRAIWGLWSINPDGRNWGPMLSAFQPGATASHWHTALPNNRAVTAHYYKSKNWGTGNLLMWDHTTGFGPPDDTLAIPYRDPKITGTFPFMPLGTLSLTPHSSSKDTPAIVHPNWNGRTGKWTHPAAAPGGMLATWTGLGPATLNLPPYPQGIICFIPGPNPVESQNDFTVIKQDDRYSYLQPVPVVTYRAIHGIDKPAELPWLPQQQHATLPVGTPYGVIGTDSFYVRESATQGRGAVAWRDQGSDTPDGYTNSEIEYVRILLQELSLPTHTTHSAGSELPERLKILADIPLRKYNGDGSPVLDMNGDPDTSFWCRLPADQAFTFAMLDGNKQQLTLAQTWHQVRPGEVRTDCRGCHAHHQPSNTPFATTVAALSDPVDLTGTRPVGYSYQEDIRPIIESHCLHCHDGSNSETDLLLDQLLSRPHKANEVNLPYRSRAAEIVKRITSDENAPGHMPHDGGSLSQDEINTIIRWVDTGVQDDNGNKDDTLPTVHMETPRRRTGPITEIVFGVADLYGIQSIRLTASWLDGEQFGNCTGVDGVYTMPLPQPVATGTVTVEAVDLSGNRRRVVRQFK